MQNSIKISNELRTVVYILDSIVKTFSIDTNRLYAVGSSIGGFGTWDIVTRYPKKFAATIPDVGAGDPSKMGSIERMGIWAFHGTLDNAVPVTGSRNMMKALDNIVGHKVFLTNCNWTDCVAKPKSLVEDTIKGAHPPQYIYTEMKDSTHSLWYSAYGVFNGMVDWLYMFGVHTETASSPISVAHRSTGEIQVIASKNGHTLRVYSPDACRLSVYSLQGKLIDRAEIQTKTISIDTKLWTKGIYLLCATANNGRYYYRVITK